MKFLYFLLAFLLSLSCDRSNAPEQRRQEMDKIIKQVADFNAQAEVHRAHALAEDMKLKTYRQEIQQFRSQTGEGRKARKALIKKLNLFYSYAKSVGNPTTIAAPNRQFWGIKRSNGERKLCARDL